PAQGVALSPDGTRIAAAFSGAKASDIRIFDAANGKELQGLDGHAGPVHALAFLGDSRTVVSAGADKAVRLAQVGILAQWDAHAGGTVYALSATRVIPASAAPLRALAVTPNGSHVLTAGDDKAIKLWNANTGANERAFAGAAGAVVALAVSKNGALVAAGEDKAV